MHLSNVIPALLAVVLAGCSSQTSSDDSQDGSVTGNGGSGGWSSGGSNSGGAPAVGGGGAKDSSLDQHSLFLEPGDITTGHDGSSVRIAVRVDDFGFGLPSSVAATLRKYPSDEIVPSSVQEEVLDGGFGASTTSWVLTPSAPLSDGWYALVVENDGKSISGSHQRADGSYETRFRIGSEPLLIGVGACASDTEALLPKLRLDFSEQVDLSGEPPIQVTVDGAVVACTTYEPPSEYGMGLTCTPPPSATAIISVEIGTGFTSSLSGLPLATSAGALPRTFELPSTSYTTETCRYWREIATPVD